MGTGDNFVLAGKTARTFMESVKDPLVLALCFMNLCLLALFFYVIQTATDVRHKEMERIFAAQAETSEESKPYKLDDPVYKLDGPVEIVDPNKVDKELKADPELFEQKPVEKQKLEKLEKSEPAGDQ